MERIPSRQEIIPLYYASSLADVANSREQALDDMATIINTWGIGLQLTRAYARICNLPERAIDKIRGREPLRSATALVYIPLIRHFPENDNPNKQDEIIIHDPTMKLEVKLPNDRLITQFLRYLQLNIDPTLIRERSWASDIVLLCGYSNRGDEFILIDVRNRHITETEKEGVFDLMRRFAVQGVGIRLPQ